MPHFDLPLEELWSFRPPRTEPEDFDAFWAGTLEMSRAAGFEPEFIEVDTPVRTLRAADVTFAGYAGQPIKGWLLWPRGAADPLTTIVEYVGYGGGRGHAIEHLLYASAGYAFFVMDTRGQGSVWRRGDTPDIEPSGMPPESPGFLTRGIEDPARYYYRRTMADAMLALDAVRRHPIVAEDRIVVSGGSQGGGLAMAAAAFGTAASAALVDVPFMCAFERALQITDNLPYQEVRSYLRTHRDAEARVWRTLSYIDGRSFAARSRMPALFSVGLEDDITPPSTVFAAYNEWAGPKEMRVWPWSGHEAPDVHQHLERFAFLARLGLTPRP